MWSAKLCYTCHNIACVVGELDSKPDELGHLFDTTHICMHVLYVSLSLRHKDMVYNRLIIIQVIQNYRGFRNRKVHHRFHEGPPFDSSLLYTYMHTLFPLHHLQFYFFITPGLPSNISYFRYLTKCCIHLLYFQENFGSLKYTRRHRQNQRDDSKCSTIYGMKFGICLVTGIQLTNLFQLHFIYF
jgi:hypothetical protein